MTFQNTYKLIFITGMIWLLPLNGFATAMTNIHVSIPPLKYFVERIGKNHVSVDVLLKPGKNPATYSPSPDQMKKLASSDIFFKIGIPFENSIQQKIKSMVNALIIDTRKGIKLRHLRAHSHGKDNIDHMGKDPHIWMNPVNVKTIASTIFSTLSSFDPKNHIDYKTNYDLFIKDLDTLDRRLKKILKVVYGKTLFVFHPSFGYFTDAYGLKQVAIETMGKAPKGKALSNIIKQAKKQKARMIFVQPQFDRNAALKIASAIKGDVVALNPLAFDYPVNMEKMAVTIVMTLKK